jgi:hypothetical protein
MYFYIYKYIYIYDINASLRLNFALIFLIFTQLVANT